MRVQVKGKIFRICHVWFEDYIPDIINSDITIFHNSNVKCDNKSKEFFSLKSDLSQSIDELSKLFSKTTRNEINRAQKDGFVSKYYTCEQLKSDNSILYSFGDTYHQLYNEKNIKNMFLNFNEINSYIENNHFLLSVSIFNDVPVIYHSYILDSKNARLLHSCSNFRTLDSLIKNSISRANRMLHKDDFIYLKKLGIKEYDWGGISSFDTPNGIDNFKMSFGGEHIKYYYIRIENNIKAKLLNRIISLKH